MTEKELFDRACDRLRGRLHEMLVTEYEHMGGDYGAFVQAVFTVLCFEVGRTLSEAVGGANRPIDELYAYLRRGLKYGMAEGADAHAANCATPDCDYVERVRSALLVFEEPKGTA